MQLKNREPSQMGNASSVVDLRSSSLGSFLLASSVVLAGMIKIHTIMYKSHAIGEFAQFDQIAQAIIGSIYSCAIHRCLTKVGHYP